METTPHSQQTLASIGATMDAAAADRVKLRCGASRPASSAAICRAKGWTAGTVVEWRDERWRITAIGERCVLGQLVEFCDPWRQSGLDWQSAGDTDEHILRLHSGYTLVSRSDKASAEAA
jgi:hypothetical protein